MRGRVDTINQPPVRRRRKKENPSMNVMLNFLNYCYYGRVTTFWTKF